jgi:hypothetical protein
MSAAVLRNKANPNTAQNKPTLDDVDRVMGLTGDHGVLMALAAKHGYVCVAIDEEAHASDVALIEIMTRCWKRNGDFGMAVNAALEDGRVTKQEVEIVLATVRQFEQSMHQLVARMRGMAE